MIVMGKKGRKYYIIETLGNKDGNTYREHQIIYLISFYDLQLTYLFYVFSIKTLGLCKKQFFCAGGEITPPPPASFQYPGNTWHF